MLFVDAQPKARVNHSKGILQYGKNDDFPTRVISAITGSPIGLPFIETYTRFLQGNGIYDENQAFALVAKEGAQNVSIDEIHEKLCVDLCWFGGITCHVMWKPYFDFDENGNTLIKYEKSINHINFDEIRLGIPDIKGNVEQFFHNPSWSGKDYKKENTTTYYDYSTDYDVITAQINDAKGFENYTGQIFYKIVEMPGFRTIPIPFWYPALKAFLVDGAVSDFHKNNIENNFLLSSVWNVVGNENAPVVDNEGKSTTTQGKAMMDKIASLMTPEKKGGILVNWSETKEGFMNITPFPSNTNESTFINLSKHIIDTISIATMVPPILACVQVTGKLGASNEVANSVSLLNFKTQKHRMFLERIYNQLLPGISINFSNVKIETLGSDTFIKSIVS